METSQRNRPVHTWLLVIALLLQGCLLVGGSSSDCPTGQMRICRDTGDCRCGLPCRSNSECRGAVCAEFTYAPGTGVCVDGTWAETTGLGSGTSGGCSPACGSGQVCIASGGLRSCVSSCVSDGDCPGSCCVGVGASRVCAPDLSACQPTTPVDAGTDAGTSTGDCGRCACDELPVSYLGGPAICRPRCRSDRDCDNGNCSLLLDDRTQVCGFSEPSDQCGGSCGLDRRCLDSAVDSPRCFVRCVSNSDCSSGTTCTRPLRYDNKVCLPPIGPEGCWGDRVLFRDPGQPRPYCLDPCDSRRPCVGGDCRTVDPSSSGPGVCRRFGAPNVGTCAFHSDCSFPLGCFNRRCAGQA